MGNCGTREESPVIPNAHHPGQFHSRCTFFSRSRVSFLHFLYLCGVLMCVDMLV